MSDWLERELARELAPVAAPEALGTRLGFAPAKRWEIPRLALAVAATVVLVIGGSFAASRTEALDLRREAGVGVSMRPAEGEQLTGARLIRCDGGAGMPLQMNADKATILLAHSGSERSGHTLAAAPEADCHYCHSL
jgi:hypothetical protein